MLVSFNTGLLSRESDKINPEKAEDIGRDIQMKHDGLDYTATMQTKNKVKPLSHLKKSVKVTDKAVYIDSMKLFTRLMVIGERELSLLDCLTHELTHLPLSLFDDKQKMRKTNKALLAASLKARVSHTNPSNVKVTVIDGGLLIHKV